MEREMDCLLAWSGARLCCSVLGGLSEGHMWGHVWRKRIGVWPYCNRFKRSEKGKDKVNAAEGTPDPPDMVNMASEHVSRSVMKCVHAYLSLEPKDSGRNTLIINSGASSHMVPHHSWFWTYQPLDPPHPVTLGDNSDAMAIGIGTVPLISHVSRTTSEIILSNVLLIPEFWISLISVNHLVSASLSTTFPAGSEKCYIQKDQNTTLVTIQKMDCIMQGSPQTIRRKLHMPL